MPTNNQNLPVRQYAPQYRQLLTTVFEKKKAFEGVLAPIQSLDGIQFNKKAFTVKTSNIPVVIGNYDKGTNVQFGAGTGTGSRFGQRTEIIYQDTDVEYDYDLAIHEGLDKHTLNNDLTAAVADRLKLHSEKQIQKMNEIIGKFLSEKAAGVEKTLAALDDTNISKLFNEINKYVVDTEITSEITAYVRPELYNAIIDMTANTTAKGSSVNIDNNGLAKYKNVKLVQTPSSYFGENVIAIFAPDGIVIPFVGIETARTVEGYDFDGIVLQAAFKGGTFILDDNKKAIVKVTSTSPLA